MSGCPIAKAAYDGCDDPASTQSKCFAALVELNAEMFERQIVVARELSKRFEEIAQFIIGNARLVRGGC